MGRKVYLTESQFGEYIKSLLLKEGVKKTHKRSAADRIREELIPCEKYFLSIGMSLFKDRDAINSLNDVADYIDSAKPKEKRKIIDEFLDDFADNDAMKFAQWKLLLTPLTGENKYLKALNNQTLENNRNEREEYENLPINEKMKVWLQKKKESKQIDKSTESICTAIIIFNDTYGNLFSREELSGSNTCFFLNVIGELPKDFDPHVENREEVLQSYAEQYPEYLNFKQIASVIQKVRYNRDEYLSKTRNIGKRYLFGFDGTAIYMPEKPAKDSWLTLCDQLKSIGVKVGPQSLRQFEKCKCIFSQVFFNK